MPKIAIFILTILILGSGFYFLFISEEEAQPKLLEKPMIKETKLETPKEAEGEISIITVYDNYQADPRFRTGWGFSALIKTESQNILFDTGADSSTLLSNMERLEISPKQIDRVVLSHIHGDHTGGLDGILEKNKNIIVYIPNSFPDSMRREIESYGAKYKNIKEPAEISKNIYSTGELGIWIKEQSLIINTDKGLVVITGCAHPGVVNIVKKAKELVNENIYLVLGGFHLAGTSDIELKNIIADFRKLEVQKVAPCHCSGDRCRELFKEEYKEDFIANGVGKIIEI